MSNQTKVCRDILDTKTVLQNKILETLIQQLASKGRLSLEECKKVSVAINKDVESQVDSLIDRTVKNLS